MLAVAVLGESFISDLEQAGLFLPGSVPNRGFSTCLRTLQRQLANLGDDAHRQLAVRVRTYRAYDNLSSFVHDRGDDVRQLLGERPFRFGKTVVSLTNLSFLREQFAFEAGKEFHELFVEYETPERLAEAASAVIALANEQRQLESTDFVLPLTGIDISDELIAVLRYGAAICALREFGKLISVLNYELSREGTADPMVYRLRPSHRETEYALRLGYIRGEIGVTAGPLHLSRQPRPQFSILAGIKSFLSSFPQLFEVKDPDTPMRRLRLRVPLLPHFYETLAQVRFYEDALREERLGQELELPMRVPDTGPLLLAAGVELETFQKAWRSLEFLAFLDIGALRQFESDEPIVNNSLMRIITEEALVDLVKVAGVESENVAPLLNLFTADVRRLGHYDMQYRPFLRVKPSTLQINGREETTPSEVILGSAIVASSNMTINVQRAHGIRIRTNADAFVTVVRATLESIFEKIRTNVALKLGNERTDVDIMILTDRTLYLIECKHSITPAGAHELRDLWRDINHGAHQLKVAMRILSARLASYLAGLFPGTTKRHIAGLRIRPCVLCSHRVFSGMTVDGIPVRDFASLALVCEDGIVGMGGENDSGEVVIQRFRLRATEKATREDFDEYLTERSRYFEMFRPFMREHDVVYRLFGGALVLAYNSFVHVVSQEEWAAHLERTGATAVSAERLPVEALRPEFSDT
ncbi:MAG: hypothetical protein F4Y45_12910 [Acidobacteria bacterium]|nr:hypothetical protein [Acidobacteriota bacterium]MYJ04219.1 hypothetical protein [Acidobacteriota bacterium]